MSAGPTSVPEITPSPPANPGRHLGYVSFRATLHEFLGRSGVSEVTFRDAWNARLSMHDLLTREGWYEPPPLGMAIFVGHDDDNQPFAFASLRPPAFWPSSREIRWQHAIMYAYCSPLDVTTGLPGDFGVTLYFGRDRKIKEHFRRSLDLTRNLLTTIEAGTTSRDLFRRSERDFALAGMRSNVASVTDSVPVDLGHSLPLATLPVSDGHRHLTADAQRAIQEKRLFISESSDWLLRSVSQFTIEPSLVSIADPSLPQVSPHYVVAVSDISTELCTEGDDMYSEFGLTS